MYRTLIKLIFFLLLLCAFVLGCEHQPQQGDSIGTEVKENSTFSVMITAFRERRSFGQVLAGAKYIFQSKRKNGGYWKTFMVYQYDDAIPIDKNSIVLVNEKVGYVFVISELAVTTDSGEAWSIWNVAKLDSLKDDKSCRIETVSISANGTGSMNVKCNKTAIVLSTEDFGVTWKK